MLISQTSFVRYRSHAHHTSMKPHMGLHTQHNMRSRSTTTFVAAAAHYLHGKLVCRVTPMISASAFAICHRHPLHRRPHRHHRRRPAPLIRTARRLPTVTTPALIRAAIAMRIRAARTHSQALSKTRALADMCVPVSPATLRVTVLISPHRPPRQGPLLHRLYLASSLGRRTWITPAQAITVRTTPLTWRRSRLARRTTLLAQHVRQT